MFDYDKWQEIIATIKHNKLRSALTMFGVFWGMFMLVLLLGGGNGLERGATYSFRSWASNSGFVWGQSTNKAYAGFQPGRPVRFKTSDILALRNEVKQLDLLAPRDQLNGFSGSNNVFYKNESGSFSVYADFPDYFKIHKVALKEGRSINNLDIEEQRKVAYIGQEVVKILFHKADSDAFSPIGEYLRIAGVNFMIVGVFESMNNGQQYDQENRNIHVPFSTFNAAFKNGEWGGWFAYSAKADADIYKTENRMKEVLASRHKVHPEDLNAIGSYNLGREYEEMTNLFLAIRIFVWTVSLGTLIAGLVGISNIMLIVVKERTAEIGIRKAMGAYPSSVVGLIVQEAIFLTTIAGGFGIATAQVILAFVRSQMPATPGADTMFSLPFVGLQISLIALSVLVIGGAFAGLVPALKAAKVSPIEAIRAE